MIPIERFIQYVAEVEKANPGDQPQEILSAFACSTTAAQVKPTSSLLTN